jgi:hypothetical protein
MAASTLPSSPACSEKVRAMKRRPVLVAAASLILLAVACESGADPGAGDAFLSEGDRAPDFALPSAGGGQIALSDFEGRKPVLLYFSMGPG